MRKLIIMLAAAVMLFGCMGNTINYITVENGGQGTVTNREDGNTTSATPTTTLTGIPGVTQ